MIIGILGYGFVGQGIVSVITQHRKKLEQALGEPLIIKTIAVRSTKKSRKYPSDSSITNNTMSVVYDDDIDLIIDVISSDSFTYIKQALISGKHVISANKSVIALHQSELLALADENRVKLLYDASVGGSIPIVQSLLHGFIANQITEITGILNGTTNYMLTRMQQDKLSYDVALKDAQDKGFAEADPYMDVSGHDVANKLAILAGVAFNTSVTLADISVTGINALALDDITHAIDLGYSIKLVGYIRDLEAGIVIRVAPVLVANTHPLAAINQEINAVMITGDCIGDAVLVGKGAGGIPTASAIVSDILGLNSTQSRPALIHRPVIHEPWDTQYLRIRIPDKPGNLEKLTHAITQSGISIKTLIQNSTRSDENTVDVLVITHPQAGVCDSIKAYLPSSFRLMSQWGVLG